jgi:large subunit ribosomal protein L21
MYAIVRTGGHQYQVREGDTIQVQLLGASAGDTISLDEVLLVADDSAVRVGTPVVDGAAVRAKVLGDVKSKKVVVFKYKNKNRYRVKTGHRQRLTRLKIEAITA